MRPTEIAALFASLKPGRIAEYVGGGRIRVRQRLATCPYYVTTAQARAAIARATAR